jgi:hypothetical protein
MLVCSVVNLLNSLLLQKFDIWFYFPFLKTSIFSREIYSVNEETFVYTGCITSSKCEVQLSISTWTES